MPSEIRPSKVGKWTEPALRVLRERYLTRKDGEVVETPEEMCWRVALSIAAGEARYGRSQAAVREIAEAFYEIMTDGSFLPNSPTLMNAGKGNGLQYSACYVLPVGDSMEEIFDSVKAAAIIHKSGGGCIAGDARVWTTFCGLEPIEVLFNRATADGRSGQQSGAGVAFDVADLGIRTVAMDPTSGRTALRPVSHVWRFDVPAESQILVRTREGTEVQTSAWHPFMVVRPQGLVALRADELTAGDVILGPDRPDDYWPYHDYRHVGSLVIDERLGWLLGFTLGDGSFGFVPSLRQHRLRWFSGERDVLENVRTILAEQGIHVSIQKDARGLLSVATLTQRFVHDMLEASGLQKIGAKDDRIRIPEIIAKSPLAVVRAFVAGLVDSDGYVASDGSPSYATASREMAEDLAGLISLLGYQPSVGAKPPHGKGRRTIYQVQLCGLPQVNDLRSAVTPFMASAHKVARLSSTSRKQTALRLPFRPWRDRLKGLGIIGTSRSGAGPCGVELSRWSCNQNGRCRRDDLQAIADAVAARDVDLSELLRHVATRGLEIASVRRAPEPKPFYDLSVSDWNTYAAGTHGMAFVHNTGFAFSRLRPKDDIVKSTGGRASGPVSFLRVFNGATEAVKQGGTRRGANMGILKVDHPDILEFIECKLDGGITNFNISVAATDGFMDALEKGEEYDLVNPHTGAVSGRLWAREVFDRIVRAAWRTGDPGMVFIDRINRSPANPTPEIGMIEATNPCIAGDSLVATDRGLLRMEGLVARYAQGGVAVQVDSRLLPARFMVWEGTHNVPLASYGQGCLPISRAFCTGERETLTVRSKAGFELVCTPDHRLMTDRGWVPAGDLKVGVDRVFIQSNPGAFGTEPRLPVQVSNAFKGKNGRVYSHALPDCWSQDLGVVLGWLVGDGWLRSGDKNCRLGFTFGAGDAEMLDRIKGIVNPWYGRAIEAVSRPRDVSHLSYHGKFFVEFFESLGVRPVTADEKVVPESLFAAPREAVVGFLQGLFSADGTVRDNPRSNSSWIALTSKSRQLLRGVQLLLLNLGIKSQILDRSRPPRVNVFRSTSAAGGQQSYGSDGVLFELGIFGQSRETFRQEVGFLNVKQARLGKVKYRGFYTQKFSDPVVAVLPAGVRSVYDLTEPQSHSMVANGFVIHQCGEQPLLPNEACNLGSLNVSKFARKNDDGTWGVDWDEMERVIRLSVRFLDDVIEMNPYPLPEIDATVKANRRIGLGIMGWADLLFMLSIPYDSDAAVELGARLMAFIKEKSHDQSARLAEERGPFPNWTHSIYKHGRPMRNSTVTTIAPTGTISMIAGCSSGVEPIFALAFEHRVKQSDGERVLTFVNETFEYLAREQGFFSDALMAEIARRGTLHGIPGVPEAAERVFRTAHDIGFEWHVRHQAAFQKSTDNGVSKTINLPNDASEAEVARAYQLAWELGCIGITVFRDGCKGEQVLNVGVGAKKDKADTSASVTPPGPVVIKPRPHSLNGSTYRVGTPIGTAFITVNETPDGEPFEVFLQVGKGGSDTMAVAEALGRLISLVLRMPSPLTSQRRLEEVISQLSRIGGAQPMGFGPAKILSLPDAIARTLAEHIGQVKSPEGAGQLPLAPNKAVGDLCKECGQATFIYEEGCKKCLSCGFNEC